MYITQHFRVVTSRTKQLTFDIKILLISFNYLIGILNVAHVTKCDKLDTLDHRQLSFTSRNLIVATTTTTTPTPVELPDFLEPIGNHTIALGRDAQLSCKINNLGNFRTAWLRVEDKGILTIHNNIITRNYRVGLINNDEGRNFILTIKNVQPSDKGGYMCQINSVPMKSAIGYLDVLTPPTFEDSPSSSLNQDGIEQQATTLVAPSVVTVLEGANASLSCKATGHPVPTITWRREDNEPILTDGSASSSVLDGIQKLEGSSIQLTTVSRLNSGAYLCIASNGVQPSASKRQVLDVQFSPIIRLPQVEIGANLNQNQVKLVCIVELNPLGSYHWVKLMQNSGSSSESRAQSSSVGTNLSTEDDLSLIDHDELTNSDKYEIVIKQANSERIQMILNIRQVERKDFAYYKCIAHNPLGTQSNSIRLYETSSFRGNSQEVQQQLPVDPSIASEQQLNDQQQDPNGRFSKQQQGSRTHTRSSWIQRVSNGRSQDSSGLSSEPNSSSPFPSNLLLPSSQILYICLLLFNYYYNYHYF